MTEKPMSDEEIVAEAMKEYLSDVIEKYFGKIPMEAIKGFVREGTSEDFIRATKKAISLTRSSVYAEVEKKIDEKIDYVQNNIRNGEYNSYDFEQILKELKQSIRGGEE